MPKGGHRTGEVGEATFYIIEVKEMWA